MAAARLLPRGWPTPIASLPAMPSKSVPGTPFGLSSGGMGGVRRSGTSPNIPEGLTQANRGYSNPDLARASPNRPETSDTTWLVRRTPMYSNMFSPVNSAPLPPTAAVAAAFTPGGAYDPYGFDEDGYGSGALYPGGSMGLKNKHAETDREFNRFTGVRVRILRAISSPFARISTGVDTSRRSLRRASPPTAI